MVNKYKLLFLVVFLTSCVPNDDKSLFAIAKKYPNAEVKFCIDSPEEIKGCYRLYYTGDKK
jgi:hypothetical protein